MFESAVQRGIARFNQHFGKIQWVEYINIDAIDMASSSRCVLGQLFGDYWIGIGELASMSNDSHYGFIVPGDVDPWARGAAWEELTLEWQAALRAQ